MGTNYYFREAVCPTCGRSDDLHIGKSSCGWCFSLHVYPEKGINDLPDWQKLWDKPGSEIVDEYGSSIGTGQMIQYITERGFPWKIFNEHETGWCLANHAIPGPNGLARHALEEGRFIGHGAGTWDLEIGEFS